MALTAVLEFGDNSIKRYSKQYMVSDCRFLLNFQGKFDLILCKLIGIIGSVLKGELLFANIVGTVNRNGTGNSYIYKLYTQNQGHFR